ncbi:hypothetical protein [Herpetosiphon geysericola]|uniref:Uncharacterized protein n=1 Tax=Herpetosiphon geysericola TaxID=70996 RepID=A0A0P6XYV7_9CHLR|nr:hypothetical protein [Herpetosiphon geysericola]KPL81555.1 hypothetical protein SE18_23385 [Herpetosiphon geysericola]
MSQQPDQQQQNRPLRLMFMLTMVIMCITVTVLVVLGRDVAQLVTVVAAFAALGALLWQKH